MEKTIDATGKTIGRVATEAAKALLGKDSVSFAKNKVEKISVVVNNASRMRVFPKKAELTLYRTYSGYPGGLKEATMKAIMDKDGYGELVRIAVKGMLPKNKLQKERFMNLTVNE